MGYVCVHVGVHVCVHVRVCVCVSCYEEADPTFVPLTSRLLWSTEEGRLVKGTGKSGVLGGPSAELWKATSFLAEEISLSLVEKRGFRGWMGNTEQGL